MVPASGAEMEFGSVSRCAVVVTQTPAGDLLHPDGSAGAVTPSKVSAKAATGRPNMRLKAAVPRLLVPSCSCSVASRVPPQVPAAVKLNERATAAPPTGRAP